MEASTKHGLYNKAVLITQ